VQVTNLENGHEVIVRINDRGPYVGERLIDVSRAAANVLGYEQAGTARVHVRYLGPAPRRVNADGRSAPAAAPAPTPAPAPLQAAQTDGPLALTVPATVETAPAAAPMLQQTSYAAPAPSGAYVVQVGAFSDLENAHRVRGLVEQAGPVNVDVRQTARGELFRVRVGPWQSREEAEAAQRVLAGLGYPEAVIAAR
jgi:rare lipoprotein A